MLGKVAAEEKRRELVKDKLGVVKSSDGRRQAAGERAIRACKCPDAGEEAATEGHGTVHRAAQKPLGVAGERGEGEAGALDERCEGAKGGDAHLVPGTQEGLSEGNKGLDIAA